MFKPISILCGAALLFSFTACDRPDSESSVQTSTPQPAATPAQMAPAPTQQQSQKIRTGKVVETMGASGYSYIQVEEPGADPFWIAVTKSDVAVGDEISFYDGIVMKDFASSKLNRTFDEIIFSNGLVSGAALAATPSTGDAAASGGSFAEALQSEGSNLIPAGGDAVETGSSKAVVPFADIKVEKAVGENSYTVGELFSKAAELNGKKIRVRGKVMKFSPKIMGLNWIHLQDGTGDPASKTHDLVVTTLAEDQGNWDTVTVEGTLAANKDFGAGYKYEVIIEESVISE